MITEKQKELEPLVFPSPKRIEAMIKRIEKILKVKQLNMIKNFPIKEGLTDCLRILNHRLKNPENEFFRATTDEEWDRLNKIYRRQLLGTHLLKTRQGRGIAVLCVDWLNGKIADNFLDVIERSIKKR